MKKLRILHAKHNITKKAMAEYLGIEPYVYSKVLKCDDLLEIANEAVKAFEDKNFSILIAKGQ